MRRKKLKAGIERIVKAYVGDCIMAEMIINDIMEVVEGDEKG